MASRPLRSTPAKRRATCRVRAWRRIHAPRAPDGCARGQARAGREDCPGARAGLPAPAAIRRYAPSPGLPSRSDRTQWDGTASPPSCRAGAPSLRDRRCRAPGARRQCRREPRSFQSERSTAEPVHLRQQRTPRCNQAGVTTRQLPPRRYPEPLHMTAIAARNRRSSHCAQRGPRRGALVRAWSWQAGS